MTHAIEWEWEALSAAALEAYAKGDRAAAIHLWDRALAISHQFGEQDPRRAASENNAALSLLLDESFDEARGAFKQATQSWTKGLAWTETMDVQRPARSSLFHLRMERRHAKAFGEVRRHRNRLLLEGGLALTQFNLGLTELFLDQDAQGDRLLSQAAETRAKVLGPNNPELGTILRVLAGRSEVEGDLDRLRALELEIDRVSSEAARSALELWRAEQPAEMNDMRRLLGAAYLTAMVHERDFL